MGMLWESAMISLFSEKGKINDPAGKQKKQLAAENDYHSFITKKTEQKPFWHDSINQAELEAAAIPINPVKKAYKIPLWLETIIRSKRHSC